jgi:hypothetical protein
MDIDMHMFIADKKVEVSNTKYSLDNDSLEITFTAALGSRVPVKIVLTKKEYMNYIENDDKKEE